MGEDSVSDSSELEKESRSLSIESCPPPGDGEILARESSADKINTRCVAECTVAGGAIVASSHRSSSRLLPCGPWGWVERTNVLVARDFGPMSGEDSSPVRVRLTLPENSMSGSLKAKIKPSNTAEQRSDIHSRHRLFLCGREAQIVG